MTLFWTGVLAALLCPVGPRKGVANVFFFLAPGRHQCLAPGRHLLLATKKKVTGGPIDSTAEMAAAGG